MKANHILYSLLLVLFLGSCSTEPRPIQYGHDHCVRCRMTIVESRFGAELVTKKGKVLTFDSAECLLHFYLSKPEEKDTYAHILVTDALNPGNLIDAREAQYLVSENFPSPMGGNLSAYASADHRDKNHAEYQGEPYDWGGILTVYQKQ